MLANELALAGVDVVVLERLSARTGLSKALNLQPRTVEVLDLRGLLGRAERRSFATVGEGHFAAIPVSYAGWDTRHPRRCSAAERPRACWTRTNQSAARWRPGCWTTWPLRRR